LLSNRFTTKKLSKQEKTNENKEKNSIEQTSLEKAGTFPKERKGVEKREHSSTEDELEDEYIGKSRNL
jgi:hypothetical protein